MVGEKPQKVHKVKIIVDANIVFSAILNTNGKIGDLLINSNKHFKFIAPDFLRYEIRNHYPKLIKLSGLDQERVMEAEYRVCKQIVFISEEQIKVSCWKSAETLVSDIDPDDIHYITYSKHFKCKIWSGDKKLIAGLEQKGFRDFITTEDLYKMYSGATS